ncbi:MAG: long-chain fatty acid--CoA ligase [Nitrospirae bacterium]|nr:long-chain fatty acid--CoA ligase [Nitrospirota bacterium]
MTLSRLLSERAKETPQGTCIKFGKRRFTYSEIDEITTLAAGGLKNSGLNIKDRAAILMENCPEYIISYFAILRAGGIAVPINIFLTAQEISFILKDCECKILIYDDKFLLHIEAVKKDIPDIKPLRFNEIPKVSNLHALSSNPPSPPFDKGGMGGFEEDADELAVFLYTSGTTGFPKGAMLTHRNLISNAEACVKFMHLSSKDRVLLFLPLFHSFSFTVCVIVSVYMGASIVLLASVKPFSKIINSIFRDRITLFVAVPTVYNILARKKMPVFLRYVFKLLSKVRMCVSGAAPLPEDTLRAFESRFGVPLLEGYGLTEASPVVSVNPLDGVRKPGSVGLPLPGIEVSVVGEDNRLLGRGEVGELIVKGPNIMKGYFNRRKETEEALKNGWLYTGDMARIDEDGYIYIVDRKKDLIIVDGMNIYPREVEDVIARLEAVEECAMVGIPDGRGSETPVLFLKKKEGIEIDEKEIREYLKGRVAQFKMPRRIIIVEELPKTATGKVKKAELRNLEQTRTASLKSS